MRFFKEIEGNHIISAGIGFNGEEIGEVEYNHLLDIIHRKPEAPSRYDYHLLTDLTWELYELPYLDPDEEEISDEEALSIILGGETA